MRSLKVSAVLVGLFAGFVVPYAVLFSVWPMLAFETPDGRTVMPTWFTPIPLLVFALMPAIAGYISARMAKVQPLLHGLLVGILGALGSAFVHGSPVSVAVWGLICVSGGVAGAWVYRKQADVYERL